MPRALLAVLVGLLVVAPAGQAAGRGTHGKAKKAHPMTALKGSSTATLRTPKRRRGHPRPAYNRLVSLVPARRAVSKAPAAPVSTALPIASPSPAAVVPIVDPTPLGSFASVRARDSGSLSFTLSRSVLAAGAIRLQLQNSGEDEHDLTVGPQSGGAAIATTSPVAPGDNATLSTTLPAGQYRLYCSLFAHAARGMQATLDVR